MPAVRKTILVLGGGFGGITAAIELRKQLHPEHRIVLVDKSREFHECAFNLSVMTGEMADPREAQGDLMALAGKGVEFVNEEVLRIDPVKKLVQTKNRSLEADYMVVALGARLAPEEIPGFTDAAHNLYDASGAAGLNGALQGFKGGKIVVLISRTPFKCPAAPYEAAFLIEALMRKKGIRDKVSVEVYTSEWAPMPVAGDEVGDELKRMLTNRGIGYFPDHMVLKIDDRRIQFEIDEVDYDLLVGVPPHEPPRVVQSADLTDSTGWVPVNPRTLETRFPHVFAVGDITSIRLRNGMFLPMAGIFAFQEGLVVASNVSADIKGEAARMEYGGEGYCFIEVGDGLAAYGSGNFYEAPAPKVRLEPPSAKYKADKDEFANTILSSLRA